MLDTALDFSRDICGHIDVLRSIFIVKKYFLCMAVYGITIAMLIVKLMPTSYMCLLMYYHKYVVTIISYNSLN